MKKLLTGLMMTLMLLTISPLNMFANSEKDPATLAVMNPAESTKAQALLTRLNEIKTMDKSSMNSPEKRKLRKEVRSIKSQLNEMGGGVYLSVGAVIIILLLLILLV